MSNQATGYRAFPPKITHPSRLRRFTEAEFTSATKSKLEEAPSACAGHAGTTIWYGEEVGYIVEVRFTSHAPVFVQSICTFTPTFGMDSIDGEFAQDAEEFVLEQVLGMRSQRLAAYHGLEDVPVEQYLRQRGLLK